MVVGYDISRDGANKKVTYGALVASMDLQIESAKNKFFSTVAEHGNGTDTSNNLQINFSKALKAYANQHKYLPERIIFYRDGVGDGQVYSERCILSKLI